MREWEIQQAEDLGWVSISFRKPPIGRPSRIVQKASQTLPAKLPPRRNEIRSGISIRHDNFALGLTMPVTARNAYGFAVSSATDSYLLAFPGARSRAGAAASASRLLKKPMIRAAKAWYQRGGLRVLDEPMPPSPAEIYRRLAEMGR